MSTVKTQMFECLKFLRIIDRAEEESLTFEVDKMRKIRYFFLVGAQRTLAFFKSQEVGDQLDARD